jgi:hypothetical protein
MRAKVYLPLSSREYMIKDNGKHVCPMPDHDHESYMYLGIVGSGFHQFEALPDKGGK